MIGVGDVVRIVAEWDIPDSTIAQLVWHITGTVGAAQTELVVLASAMAHLEAAWLHIDQDISENVLGSTFSILLWDFALNRWDGVGDAALLNADGSNVTDMIAHGVSALAKIFTGQARRQARKYIMGYCENNLEDGTLSAAALVQIALFAGALDNPFNAGALTLAFCTFNTDTESPLYETSSIASGSVQAESIAAYQRRRRPGTGI